MRQTIEEMRKNNYVKLTGKLGVVTFSHEVHNKKYYKTTITSKRTSGVDDVLNLVIPESVKAGLSDNCKCTIDGNFRSRNVPISGGHKHLELYVYATNATIVDETVEDENYFRFDGFLWRDVVYRKTPKGRRIGEIYLAVNRITGESDYIPCLTWGNNADRSRELKTGDRVIISGILESRKYNKVYEDGTEEEKTAYEASARSYTKYAIPEKDENVTEEK